MIHARADRDHVVCLVAVDGVVDDEYAISLQADAELQNVVAVQVADGFMRYAERKGEYGKIRIKRDDFVRK